MTIGQYNPDNGEANPLYARYQEYQLKRAELTDYCNDNRPYFFVEITSCLLFLTTLLIFLLVFINGKGGCNDGPINNYKNRTISQCINEKCVPQCLKHYNTSQICDEKCDKCSDNEYVFCTDCTSCFNKYCFNKYCQPETNDIALWCYESREIKKQYERAFAQCVSDSKWVYYLCSFVGIVLPISLIIGARIFLMKKLNSEYEDVLEAL